MIRRPLAILCLFVVAGCQQKPFEPFKSPDGKFEAKFPGPPQVKATSAGGVNLKMYSVEAWNRAFMIGYADLPIPKYETEGKTNSRLFDARDGALEAVKAKSNGSTKVIQHQNRFPGIEFGGSAEDKHLRAQIFLVGHRLYQVLVVGGSQELLNSPEAEEFFASFQVFDVEGLLPAGSSAALPRLPPMHPIDSSGGRFIASYPAKPKKFSRTVGDTAFTGYESESKDGTCSVGYADLPIPGGEPDEKIRERIDAARNAALGDAKMPLGSEKDVTIGSGRPGREFTGTAEGKHLRGRVFLVGARLYQITVLGTETFANSREATAFLDSFQLK
jgi:hypothetical protein